MDSPSREVTRPMPESEMPEPELEREEKAGNRVKYPSDTRLNIAVSDKRRIMLSRLPDSIRANIDIHYSDCWLWTGTRFTTGYGLISKDGKLWKAHRLVWTLTCGPIPPGIHCCHRCDVPLCVNPEHLFLGTNRDNQQDKASKGRHWQQKKTACPQGHVYTPENTYISKPGHRRCLTCLNAGRKAARRA